MGRFRNDDKRYLSELKLVAACSGYPGKIIDRLLSSAFFRSPETFLNLGGQIICL